MAMVKERVKNSIGRVQSHGDEIVVETVGVMDDVCTGTGMRGGGQSLGWSSLGSMLMFKVRYGMKSVDQDWTWDQC
jgi:hypothetical protein